MGVSDQRRHKTGMITRVFGALTCATIMTLPAMGPVMAQSHPTQGVMEADRAFAARAKQVGAGQAFSEYAEARVSMLNDPVPGTDNADLAKIFSPDLEIDWGPVDGAVSVDGTLGYTWGKARYHKVKPDGTKEELPPSRYVTIWRKQKDGSWKFLADGGLHAPEAKEFAEKKKAAAEKK
ncbi:YybH family protein [Niveispirillum sp. KHB5.9]|uniref:YybH family protein n=1 Tax=Niveispirillum sp. KHB5.9 TaxID=3400269 RepID=UPI003A863EAA